MVNVIIIQAEPFTTIQEIKTKLEQQDSYFKGSDIEQIGRTFIIKLGLWRNKNYKSITELYAMEISDFINYKYIDSGFSRDYK